MKSHSCWACGMKIHTQSALAWPGLSASKWDACAHIQGEPHTRTRECLAIYKYLVRNALSADVSLGLGSCTTCITAPLSPSHCPTVPGQSTFRPCRQSASKLILRPSRRPWPSLASRLNMRLSMWINIGSDVSYVCKRTPVSVCVCGCVPLYIPTCLWSRNRNIIASSKFLS